jgi:ureidoglycolate lyase
VQILNVKRLTSAAFAPFGEVLSFDLERSRLVNDGRALRSDMQARLDSGQGQGSPVLAVYRARGESLPFSLTTFERHPLSSQTFVALSAERFLIVVAPHGSSNLPDLRRCEAFIGHRGEGVNYSRDIWHAPITALGQDGDFLMFMWESGRDEDCILHHPENPLLVHSLEQAQS